MTSCVDFLFFTRLNALPWRRQVYMEAAHPTQNTVRRVHQTVETEVEHQISSMNAGRLIYKTILQINNQYSSNRLPLTGIVGFSQSRFRYPVSLAVKEAFNAQRDNPDLDCKSAVQRCMLIFILLVKLVSGSPANCYAAGFKAIKQLQAQYGVLSDAGPIEQASTVLRKEHLPQRMQAQLATLQVSYAIWQQSLMQASQQVSSPHAASAAVVWGGFVASKMLRHPHPGQTMTRWIHCIECSLTVIFDCTTDSSPPTCI